MNIAHDIQDRIIAAANALYEEGNRLDFPPVAAVRARAGVDMNAANTVMRDWRKAHMALLAPMTAEIPERVRTANITALTALWAEAQIIANESLLSARAAWEAEQAGAAAALCRELEAAQAQLASQAEELHLLQVERQRLLKDAAQARESAALMQEKLQATTRQYGELTRALVAIGEGARGASLALPAPIGGKPEPVGHLDNTAFPSPEAVKC